jgi:hypothetical protein
MPSLNLSKGLCCAVLAAMAGGAQASVEYGRIDGISGLMWIKADTLAEGESLGFRPATSQDFFRYLNNADFHASKYYAAYPNPGYRLYYAGYASNKLMGFNGDIVLNSPQPDMSDISVSMGLLDGDGKVGALSYVTILNETRCGQGNPCPPLTLTVTEAAYGTLAEFETVQADNVLPPLVGDWVAALAQLRQADGTYKLGHFMVSSVPESGTLPLMMAGLLGMALVARRKSVA